MLQLAKQHPVLPLEGEQRRTLIHKDPSWLLQWQNEGALQRKQLEDGGAETGAS